MKKGKINYHREPWQMMHSELFSYGIDINYYRLNLAFQKMILCNKDTVKALRVKNAHLTFIRE